MTAYDVSIEEEKHRFSLAMELALYWLQTMKPRPDDHACAICGCSAGEHGPGHAFAGAA